MRLAGTLLRLAAVVASLSLAGCGGTTEISPAGASIVSNKTHYQLVVDPNTGVVSRVPVVEETFNAQSHSAAMTTDSPNAAANMHTDPPAIKTPDGAEATGGGSESAFKVFQKTFDPGSAFFWAGLATLAGGGFLIYRQRFTTGAIVAASGFFLMASSAFSWLILVAIAGVIGALVYEGYKHGFFKEAGRTLVSAAKSAGVLTAVQGKIDEHATGTDVNAIKQLQKLET